ncbi:MAG TPA: hypothetical protein PKV26_10875 [Bacillota bacterium]|nr:hypothetical protein [Bacillota bacterium]
MTLTAEVIEIRGRCSAGLKTGDTMVWSGSCVSGERICAAAVKSVVGAAGRAMLESGSSAEPVVSCLDAGPPYTNGGCVRFRLRWDPPFTPVKSAAGEPAVLVRVVESDACPGGLQPGDQFAVRGRFVEPGSGGKICVYALAQLVPLLAQLLPAHPEGRTVTHGTCPSGGRCGRVVFQLTREGTEPLGELVLQYQRALTDTAKAGHDTGTARRLSEKSMAAQKAGDIKEGIRLLQEAISTLAALRQPE